MPLVCVDKLSVKSTPSVKVNKMITVIVVNGKNVTLPDKNIIYVSQSRSKMCAFAFK